MGTAIKDTMSRSSSLSQRVEHLEAEMERLKGQVASIPPADQRPWWEQISGSFKNDPIYDAAMKLGREYRRSLRPRVSKGSRRNGRS